MPHILAYILPLQVAKRGNLWRFSSAKLEARGGRVKKIARAVVSWQPKGVYKKTVKKSRKGDASVSNTRVITVSYKGGGARNVLDRYQRPTPRRARVWYWVLGIG